jgi:hypothetical protein
MVRRIAIALLAFCALTNLVRGCIHMFAPDGGAHSIAGLDLSTNAQTILSLFATMGAHQLAMGLFETFVLFFRRDFLVALLGLQTVETVLGTASLLLWRPLPKVVPGDIFNSIMAVALVAVFAAAVIGERRAAAARQA